MMTKMRYSHLTVTILCLTVVTVSVTLHRSRRNLYNFQSMVKAVTGRSSLDYNNYGNWCGKGGKNEPVDEVDRCCQQHDFCYYALNRKECSAWFLTGVYLVPYKWDLVNEAAVCQAGQNPCPQTLCECDRTCVECFARNEYNETNKHGWWG